MIKISLKNIFLGFLSFTFLNENFSPNSQRSIRSNEDSIRTSYSEKQDSHSVYSFDKNEEISIFHFTSSDFEPSSSEDSSSEEDSIDGLSSKKSISCPKKENIFCGKKRKNTRKFLLPEDKSYLLQEMSLMALKKEKEQRIKALLELGAPVIKISPIVHVDYRKIKKLAEKWDIKTREGNNKFKIPEDKAHLFQDMDPMEPQEVKKERMRALFELKAPLTVIASIIHVSYKKVRAYLHSL